MSPEVGFFTAATTCRFSSIRTASVFVPPTSMPNLYIYAPFRAERSSTGM